MKRTTRRAASGLVGLASLFACLGLGSAGAQTIYRCGNSYSQAPCAGGQVIEAAEPPASGPQARGTSAMERDLNAAAILEKDRLRLEANAARAYIPPPAAAGREARAAKPRKPEQFTAKAPGKPQDKKKPKKKTAKG